MKKSWSETLYTIEIFKLSQNMPKETYFQWNDKMSIQLLSSDLDVLFKNVKQFNQ